MKHLFKIVFFLLVTFQNLAAQVPAAIIPDFNFFKLNGNSFSNNNLAHGKLLFFVFFDVSCEHCQHAIKDINLHYKEFNKTAVYLVSVDIKERINTFLDTYGKNLKGKTNVTVLQDLKNEFILKFKPRKYPAMFLYSTEQTLLLYDDNEQNLATFLQKIKA